jgi:hypothetical protein
MSVASGGVANKVNTTSGQAIEVIALNGIAGTSVVELLATSTDYINTESGSRIDTEAGNNLITQ